MERQRRLRRLVPDRELFRRRAAGEPLRALAADYDVEHTTLSRYFSRPEARRQLRQAERLLRAARSRPLRRLVPDRQLFRRRAAGEPLRALAGDYGVRHTTLSRYFSQPEARRQLKQARASLREERRAARGERREQRQFAREVQRKAREQAACEREQTRRERAVRANIAARRGDRTSAYAVFLDEHDLRRRPSRADLASANDRKAAQVVEAGGGIAAVLEITGLRTQENLLRLIDPATLKQALQNDAVAAATEPAD